MKTFNQFILLIIFFFFLFPGLFGQYHSSFDYKKGNLATVFPMENDDREESFLLAFRFPSRFDLVFLDDSLGLKRMQNTEPFPPNLWDKGVLGAINKEEYLYVFMPAATHVQGEDIDLYKFNKEDGSAEVIPVKFSDEQTKLLAKPPVRLVKVFQFQDRFYKIWVNTRSSFLHIFYYDLNNPDDMGFESLEIPDENFSRILGMEKFIPVPVITDPSQTTLIHAASQQKIYMQADRMIISIEDIRHGTSEFLSLDTYTWELAFKEQAVQGFIEKKRRQNFNSYLYNGALYQVLYNLEGLSLQKTDFATGGLIDEIQWLSVEDFIPDFPLRKTRIFNGRKSILSETDDPWKWFHRSIAVLIQAEASSERLVIGSRVIPNLDIGFSDIVDRREEFSFVGGSMDGTTGFAIMGYGGSYNLNIAQFSPISPIIEAAHHFRNHGAIVSETYFESETFSFSSEPLFSRKWNARMENLEETNKQHKLRSVCLFTRGDKTYVGYWNKKRYFMLVL